MRHYYSQLFNTLILLCLSVSVSASGWMHYGGGLDGTRYASSAHITPENVQDLAPAWTYRTGDSDISLFGKDSEFKATPILFDNKLIVSSGLNRVHAVEPDTGKQLWVFDPKIDLTIKYAEMFASRGVSAWSDPQAKSGKVCTNRIFLGTLDARLIAIDAANGKRCPGFGKRGEINLAKGISKASRRGEYLITSPPTVVNDTVVVGSSIGDNSSVRMESGLVRAFDAKTAELKWRWDPIPRTNMLAESQTWENESWRYSSAANVWTAMAADSARNLVFLPTTSPAPDFYGGERLGDNAWANSVVALDVTTGEKVWAYQTIKHDLWDYDLAAQPLLVDVPVQGTVRPLLVQASKTGFIFILDRETGEPVFGIEERTVPASDVPGERAATTQIFPALRLHPEPKTIPPIFKYSDAHVDTCERLLEGVRFQGIFTPPSLEGTLIYPGNPGGVNWGSMAAHHEAHIGFTVVTRLPTVIQLIPRADFKRLRATGKHRGVNAEYTEQKGTPYGMMRFDLYNPALPMACLEGPWSTLVAIDLKQGKKLWEVPAGVPPGLEQHPRASQWGSPANKGGAIVTAGGIVFLATQFDAKLRAYNMQNGVEIWNDGLPAQPHAWKKHKMNCLIQP
ncbi:MAG: PQQ-binding-like beta-propeller repeat protein [Pseudomonadota bacterium]